MAFFHSPTPVTQPTTAVAKYFFSAGQRKEELFSLYSLVYKVYISPVFAPVVVQNRRQSNIEKADLIKVIFSLYTLVY